MPNSHSPSVISRFDRELETVSGRESPFPDSAAGNPDREIPVSRLGRETGNRSPGRRAGDFLVWHCHSPPLTRKPEIRILHCGTAPGRAGASHLAWAPQCGCPLRRGAGRSVTVRVRVVKLVAPSPGRSVGSPGPGPLVALWPGPPASDPAPQAAARPPRLAAGVLIEARLIKLSCQG
jgi:hypothetical protein